MQNLCGDPKVHFMNHIESGRRLINNKPQRCTTCDGFGYLGNPPNALKYNQKFITCELCNGTGKREL